MSRASKAIEMSEGAFKKLVHKIEGEGESEHEAKAVAAIAGRKSLGKKEFDRRAAAGRRKAAHEARPDDWHLEKDDLNSDEPDTSDTE